MWSWGCSWSGQAGDQSPIASSDIRVSGAGSSGDGCGAGGGGSVGVDVVGFVGGSGDADMIEGFTSLALVSKVFKLRVS